MVVSAQDDSNSGLSRFFDSVPLSLGIVEILEDNLLYVAINNHGARIHGVAPHEMIGKTGLDMGMPPELMEQWLAHANECYDKRQECRFEYFRKTATGDRWRCANISPLEGESRRVCFIVEDLTEVKAQLRAEERKLQALVSNIPGAVFRSRCDDNWKLDFMSESVEEMLGYTPEEFLSGAVKFVDVIHAADYPEVVRIAEEAVANRSSYTVEYRVQSRDGRTLWVSERGKVAWDEGSRSLVLDGAIFDVTDRRHMIEELIEAREGAMEASQLKSEFLANMSHEIRTPLNGVVGMTELMLGTDLNEDQKDYADTILQSADTLLHIINDILDFSKIEAGKMSIERVELDLARIIQETGELFASRAHSKDIELIVDYPESIAALRFGDPVRIKQVLSNLVSNALKFTESGEITLRVESLPEGPSWLRILVQDTGIGIPEERHAAIFDSFTQADGSTTRRYGGTGLGLAIVRQLALLMGGKIGMESQVGEGSSFWVDLPLELQAVQPALHTHSESLEGLRILVVDDNATNRKVLSRLLATQKCDVSVASSAGEAITAVSFKPAFDLILLDYQMPEIDGMELARTISRLRQSIPPMVMLSSVGQIVSAELLNEVGIVRSLTKPVRQSELLSVLLDVTDSPILDKDVSPILRVENSSAPINPLPLLSVLVVEDNFVNRKVCQKILERNHCQVDFAENGAEALDRVAEKEYGLVLMDLQMPIMDGFETTLAIRALDREQGKHTPIVALTAHAMRGDREKCIAIGMDDYLTKPVKPQDLDQMVERWARRLEAA